MRPVIVPVVLLLFALPMIMATDPIPAKVLVIGNPHNINTVALWLEGDPMMDPRQVPARTHLTDLQGKVVFLSFWASWCPSCRAEMPEIETVYQKYKDKLEFSKISSGMTFEELYDIETLKPKPEHTKQYEEVFDELESMGVPLKISKPSED